MNLNIDLVNDKLNNKSITIPIYYRQSHESSFTFSVNSYEIIKLQLPVNHMNGNIIITEKTIDSLYIPETLTTAVNGFATIEIHNNTNEHIITTLHEPLKLFHFLI